MAGRDDPRGDGGNLLGRLAGTENHLRKTLARAAMVIDPGEAQVLERRLAYKLKELVVRGLRRELTRADGFEQRAKLVTVHRPKWLAFVDFPFSRAIKSEIVRRDGFIFL